MIVYKVICSDCGHHFKVVQNGEDFEPVNCPDCGKTIHCVTPSPTTDDFVARMCED